MGGRRPSNTLPPLSVSAAASLPERGLSGAGGLPNAAIGFRNDKRRAGVQDAFAMIVPAGRTINFIQTSYDLSVCRKNFYY